MFGIGMTELMVIFVIALIVLGPKRLPELARSLGKSLNEFRRASTDLRREFLDVAEDARPESTRRPEPPAPEAPAPPAPDAPPSGASQAATKAGDEPSSG